MFANLKFVDDVRAWWKMFSVWAMLLLGIAPDLFNLAIQSGLITDAQAPAALSYLMKVIAFVGVAGRLIKQKAVEQALLDKTK